MRMLRPTSPLVAPAPGSPSKAPGFTAHWMVAVSPRRRRLANPLGEANTLIDAFLALPHLQNVITDSHFMPRERLGRLIGWVARLRAQTGNNALIGIGVDEATALAVEADGQARVLTGDAGKVWLVQPAHAASVLVLGQPLSIEGVRVTGLDSNSRYHLPSGTVDAASDEWTAAVDTGTLSLEVHAKD
jgi:cyanophycinase